jgi:hypothetical protein
MKVACPAVCVPMCLLGSCPHAPSSPPPECHLVSVEDAPHVVCQGGRVKQCIQGFALQQAQHRNKVLEIIHGGQTVSLDTQGTTNTSTDIDSYSTVQPQLPITLKLICNKYGGLP